MDALEHQRLRLRGVRWIYFYENRFENKPFADFRFRAEAGLHLGKPAMAVMTNTNFVAIRYIETSKTLYSRDRSFALKAVPLNPAKRGYFTLNRTLPQHAPILMELIIKPEEFTREQPQTHPAGAPAAA